MLVTMLSVCCGRQHSSQTDALLTLHLTLMPHLTFHAKQGQASSGGTKNPFARVSSRSGPVSHFLVKKYLLNVNFQTPTKTQVLVLPSLPPPHWIPWIRDLFISQDFGPQIPAQTLTLVTTFPKPRGVTYDKIQFPKTGSKPSKFFIHEVKKAHTHTKVSSIYCTRKRATSLQAQIMFLVNWCCRKT